MGIEIAGLTEFLAPFLSFLLGLGQKAAEKGATTLGDKSVTVILPQARKLWDRLWPIIQAKPAALEAAEDVARSPEDEDAISALSHQLKKILTDPKHIDLAAELTKIWEEVEATKSNETKFNIQVKDSQVGAIGDHTSVTMNIGNKPQG